MHDKGKQRGAREKEQLIIILCVCLAEKLKLLEEGRSERKDYVDCF